MAPRKERAEEERQRKGGICGEMKRKEGLQAAGEELENEGLKQR